MKSYSYGKQNIDKKEIKAVIDVLKSDWLTQGPKVKEFEKALCDKFGSKYASAVCNGTAALHLAGLALGWKQGDIVITSPITFLASANCILYSGATPDFVDIDSISYNIDVNKLEEKIKCYTQNGKNVKAVIGVDYAGHPCDWENLKSLSKKYKFQLVNDNCHALGATYKNNEKYAVKYADAVCQSFHPVKNFTTGEGGAVLTNNKEIDKRIKILRTHGVVKNNSEFRIQNSELKKIPWYYEMQFLGFNYRITDFQCALGISQIKKLDRFVKRRKEIAEYYNKAFDNNENFILPTVNKNSGHAYHLYPLQIKFENLKFGKKELFEKLSSSGIKCQVHYIPVHLQPYYKNNFGFKPGDFPISEKFYERQISIPMYPSLDETDLNYISSKIIDTLK